MDNPQKTRLLVSVRSAAEAILALAGGAELIDVKEPLHGPLGRADVDTVEAVVCAVAGRMPVSAALGELEQVSLATISKYSGLGLRFIKLGLSYCREIPWQKSLLTIREHLGDQTSLVPTAYGDGDSVSAPAIAEIVTFTKEHGFSHFLLDTYHKDGRTLLDHPETYRFLESVVAFQTATGIEIALAGSLGLSQIPRVARYRPAWIAVRGAACKKGRRNETICEDRVREIARALKTGYDPSFR